MKEPEHLAAIAIVGVGNPLVGDDGAGVAVVERLRERWGSDPRVLLLTLEGDLLEISEYLARAARFVFADAVVGEEPGAVGLCPGACRAYAPSFHQADLGTTLVALENLDWVKPFPPWEVWGVTVDVPREVRLGLTPAVDAGVNELVGLLSDLIEEAVRGAPASGPGPSGTLGRSLPSATVQNG